MPSLDDTLNGESKPTIEDIASALFTNDNGVAYTDLLAVGANPTAKIYRDGTVIGSTDNGVYTRWANGILEIYYISSIGTTTQFVAGAVFVAESGSLQLPISPIGDYSVINKVKTNSSHTWAGRVSTTGDTVNLAIHGITNTASGFQGYEVAGRWK